MTTTAQSRSSCTSSLVTLVIEARPVLLECVALQDEAQNRRRLLVHPQRATTSMVFMVMGAATVAGTIWMAIAGEIEPTVEHALGSVALLGFAGAFGGVGLNGWLTSVELRIERKILVMTWQRWPRGHRVVRVPVADVRDVVVEVDDSCARIALICKLENVALSESSTTDDLRDKARAIRRFLGVADPEAVPVVDAPADE